MLKDIRFVMGRKIERTTTVDISTCSFSINRLEKDLKKYSKTKYECKKPSEL